MPNKFLSVAFILTVVLAGINPAAAQENNRPTAATSSQIPAATSISQAAGDNLTRYRIGFGDIIEIDVFKHPEYKQTVRVEPHGLVSLPRIAAPITVLCKTETELMNEIAVAYQKYLRNPFVRVSVKEHYSQPLAVIGAVDKPGRFQLMRRMRLLEALSLAGGPNDKAGARVKVARLGNVHVCDQPTAGSADDADDLSKLLYSYNLRKVMEGDEASNPWMRPGDVISILEAEQIYVVGNVKKPTAVDLKEPVTLTQAIARAEGILPASKTKKVRLIRHDINTNVKTETLYDLSAINKRQAADPVLQPNDIVEVPTDETKRLRDKVLSALTGGLSSLPFLIP